MLKNAIDLGNDSIEIHMRDFNLRSNDIKITISDVIKIIVKTKLHNYINITSEENTVTLENIEDAKAQIIHTYYKPGGEGYQQAFESFENKK